MGYSCPVCGDPQADDEHLANHLAFTAMIRGGDHEEWLDENVPDWESLGETELGDVVSEMAEDEEYPQVFEDTTGPDHEHPHDHVHAHDNDHPQGHAQADGSDRAGHTPAEELPDGAGRLDGAELDGAPDDVLSEARELTRKRHEAQSEGDEDNDEAQSGEDEDSDEAQSEGDEDSDEPEDE
jgi:hypothetical protein